MVSLVSKTAADGLVPVTHGGVTLSEVATGPITWVAPFDGKAAAVSKALKRAVGAGLPEPNRFTQAGDVRLVWIGPGQALVLGAAVLPEGAAVADQSGGWCWLALEGAGAREVLARLVSMDLRADLFREGHAARTLVFHMTAVLMRSGPDRYEIGVFRSMAATAVHDLSRAMAAVAARGAD